MRLLRNSLLVTLLGVTSAFSPTARAQDPAERPPAEAALEKAEQLEAKGRSMIEQGHRVDGAKAIAKAWQIRAEVWGAEQQNKRDEPRPEIIALKERIAQWKAASNAAEQAGKQLKADGKMDDAHAKMEEAGRLWREAEDAQKKLEYVARAEPFEKAGWQSPSAEAAERKAKAARARAEAEEAYADAKRAEFEGKETAAAAAMERVHRLKLQIRELEAVLDIRKPAPAPKVGLEAQVQALHQQVSEMRAMLEDVRKRLSAQDK